MAKRNIRAKAKSAVGAVKQKAQEMQAKLKKDARQHQMLHKTLVPKTTKTKKEKSEQKHKKLIKRFANTKKELQIEKATKKRTNEGGVAANLRTLRDALPALSDIYKLVKSQGNETTNDQSPQAEPQKLSAKQKIRMKRNECVKKVQSFEKLMKDKNFKKNPREVIANHMRNKYHAMEEDE